MAEGARCVVVDLDGTLVRTDLFLEALLRFFRRNPINVLRFLGWVGRGRHVAKDEIASVVDIEAASLPYEEQILTLLREEKARGSYLVLATAAPRAFADRVAAHLGFFDHVIASDRHTNVKGAAKLAAIREHLGGREFVYAGDDDADQVIWDSAEAGIFVNAPRHAMRSERNGKSTTELSTRAPFPLSFVRQMRVHQWVKNLLILLPLMASRTDDLAADLEAALVALVCFCLCSSSVYFLNDLLDLHEDRRHPTKRNRPLAAGDLSVRTGVIGTAGLAAASFAIAAVGLPPLFLVVMLAYFVTSTAYSIYLKKIWAVDAITLAGLYTLRILGGTAAIAVAASFWLLSFSVFLFLGLAYLKRYVEFSTSPGTTYGRGYTASDSESMFSLGVANMTVAVLVVALYVNESATAAYYETPELLWLLCVVLMYWSNRIWFKARRGLVDDDPVVWALRDTVSRVLGVAIAVIILAARFLAVPL